MSVSAANDSAKAATSGGQCYYFNFDGVIFHTYDYTSEQASCNNVDWTTNLFFYGWAHVNRIKSILDNEGYEDGSTDSMHMPVRTNYESLAWDSDAGKKEIACPPVGSEARHYRLYAPSQRDYFYTPDFGYFVVGTTHKDANECPPIGKKHFASEEVEQHIADQLDQAGYFVTRDWADFSNWEPYRVEGNHVWQNNGYATYIEMP